MPNLYPNDPTQLPTLNNDPETFDDPIRKLGADATATFDNSRSTPTEWAGSEAHDADSGIDDTSLQLRTPGGEEEDVVEDDDDVDDEDEDNEEDVVEDEDDDDDEDDEGDDDDDDGNADGEDEADEEDLDLRQPEPLDTSDARVFKRQSISPMI